VHNHMNTNTTIPNILILPKYKLDRGRTEKGRCVLRDLDPR